MDFSRKGVVVSRTNLIENKKNVSLPWKGFLTIVIITGGLWFGGNFYLKYSESELAKVKNDLSNLRLGRDYEKMSLIADRTSRLVSIEAILKDRFDWEKLLLELEKNTIKEITYNSMTASYASPESSTLSSVNSASSEKKCNLTLAGTTMGIVNVSKQLATFKDDKNEASSFAKKLKLGNIGLTETSSSDGSIGLGNVDFDFILEVNLDIFTDEENLNTEPDGLNSNVQQE